MPTAVVGVANFTYGQQGWQEKYFLGDNTLALNTALLRLQNIVYGRSAFYGTGCACIFARVSSTDSSHDGLACQLPYPVGPHPSWGAGGGLPGDTIGPPNDPDTVVQMRFETSLGKYWQRYYRCMPDTWVLNKALATGILQYFTTPAGTPTPTDLGPTSGLSHLQVCQGFWLYLIANTRYARKTGTGQYTISNFDYITFRQVTDKKIGRPFGMSRGRRPKNLVS